MILRSLTVALLPFSLLSLYADEVTLVNGDRITGAVVKGDGKTLTIKTEFIGVVTLPWDKVKTIRTDAEVNVGLTGGESWRGKLETREEKIDIITENARREAALAQIVALRDAAEQRAYERLLRPSWTRVWAGTVTLGLTGTEGNAETRTLSTSLDAARITSADKTTVYFDAIRASALIEDRSATTAQAIRGGWGYNRNVSTRFSLHVLNDYEYDRFQHLDLRFVLGAGVGFSAWKADTGRLDFLVGGAYNRESFSPPEPQSAFTRNAGEAYIGDDFAYKLTPVTAVYQNLKLFLSGSELGRFRFNLDVGASTRLAHWLSWNVALNNRYLSAPVLGRQKNDFQYTTGLGVTFAR